MSDEGQWANPATAHVPRELTPENVRRWVSAYLAHVLDRPESEVDLFQELSAYGLDSVDAVVMAGELEEHFRVELDPALFLKKLTLGQLLAQFDAPAS